MRMLGRIMLAVVFAMAFAMRAPMVCHGMSAASQCPLHSHSAPPAPCCNNVTCLSSFSASHETASVQAPRCDSLVAMVPVGNLIGENLAVSARARLVAISPSPPRRVPRIIEFRTLLI